MRMQKLNVLFISSWYPNKEHKTLGNFVQRHAEAINSKVNVEVLYVVSSSSISSLEIVFEVINKVNTTIVYYPKAKNSIPILSTWLKYNLYLKAFKLGYETIIERTKISKFDLNHVNVCYQAGLVALYLKKKHKLPYIISEHWTYFLKEKKEKEGNEWILHRNIKNILSNAEAVLPVSTYLGESIKKEFESKRIEVVPNVVDTDLFKPDKIQISNFKKDTINILHVSTLRDKQKNIKGIFRVIKRISSVRQDFKLSIVSDGDIVEAQRLMNEIGLENKFVEFIDTQTPQNLVRYYQKSDFSINFSHYETFCIVLAESWSCGKPIVCSTSGGIANEMNDKLGITCEPGNEEAFFNAVLFMMDHFEEYDAKYLNEFVLENYSTEAVSKKFFDVYNKVLS